MTYSKPEVKALGEATVVIEFHQKVAPPRIDAQLKVLNPAYDLDE